MSLGVVSTAKINLDISNPLGSTIVVYLWRTGTGCSQRNLNITVTPGATVRVLYDPCTPISEGNLTTTSQVFAFIMRNNELIECNTDGLVLPDPGDMYVSQYGNTNASTTTTTAVTITNSAHSMATQAIINVDVILSSFMTKFLKASTFLFCPCLLVHFLLYRLDRATRAMGRDRIVALVGHRPAHHFRIMSHTIYSMLPRTA